MVIRNLENKIKLVGIIRSFFLVGCIIISVSSIWTARTMVTDAQQKVYVLDGNVPVLVNRTTMEETLDVEAKSHVGMFHHFFFTLPPDDKYIRYTMEKAMYLVNETGLAQYNTLKEKGFYSNILGTSAVFSIYCDSVRFDKSNMEFTYYGRQRIERRSNILMRELVTAGQLKRMPRTENNLLKRIVMNIKGFRRMLFGEKMPDKNDPQYKERYERDVNAGRKFARMTRLDKMVVGIQRFVNKHKILFLALVFGLVTGTFTFNICCLARVYRQGQSVRSTTEMQDSLLRERHREPPVPIVKPHQPDKR